MPQYPKPQPAKEPVFVGGNPPTIATAETIHEISQDYATIGGNPRKEQVQRVKKVYEHLELAQMYLEQMGAVYEEFKNDNHSAYCQAVWTNLEMMKEAMKTFAGHM